MSNTNLNPSGSGYRPFIKDASTTLTPDDRTGLVTLVDATTYYVPIGGHDSPTPGIASVLGIHMSWASAVRATITFERCNFPGLVANQNVGPTDVAVYDTTAGNWIPITSSSQAILDVVGATATGLSTATTGVGGLMIDIHDLGSRRVRAKVVVTTGGTARCNPRGKVA